MVRFVIRDLSGDVSSFSLSISHCSTAYQANLFAADLLIDDEEIEDMVQNEDLDYFGLCSSLNATPELMSFKLYSLTKRGQAYHMPMEIQSNFLAK